MSKNIRGGNMANIKIDLENAGYSKNQIYEHAAVVEDIHNELIAKSKEEQYFCGWINLPSKYKNSEEYNRIKKAAEKIRNDSDVLLVIGIGGSYLGARAVIESLHSSMLIPLTAIGKSPTGVKTENLPPTSSGITNVSYFSALDNVFKAPFLLSVVTYILFLASSIPYLPSIISLKILKAIAGSVVVPDFEITFMLKSFPSIKCITSLM